MAAREHRVSRRVLLGAACVAPVLSAVEGLIRHPELDSGSMSPPAERPTRWILNRVQGDEKWQKALTRFRRAQAVIDAAVHEPDQRRYDALLDTFSRALRRLLRTPAPDLPALSVKLDLAIDQAAWESTGGDACMAALKRDARRLAGIG